MSLQKPEKLIITKAIVAEPSKCYQGRCIAIETKGGRELIIVTKDDDDLLSVVSDLCGHRFKVDMDGVKNVSVFGTKDTMEIKKSAPAENENVNYQKVNSK